ncbi:MAG: nucleoside kinase, partial [Kiritimatiellaeota bacterium]|nr:nucleoside kinase [Kiritimatiellota bacterium]
NETIRECGYGTPLLEILGARTAAGEPYVAALYNNEVVSLGDVARMDGTLEGLTATAPQGWRVWQRSMGFLLAKAAQACYPAAGFRLQHSMGTGLVFSFDRATEEASVVAGRLNGEMSRLVAEDIPIQVTPVGYTEALRLFEASGQTDKLNLLRHRNSPVIALRFCEDYCDLAQGPVTPSTGTLSPFRVVPYEGAFVLHLPVPRHPLTLPPFVPQRHLFAAYREHDDWGRMLGIQTVGQLNASIHEKRIGDVIQMCEARHDQRFNAMAREIAERAATVKVVLLAGPSSAGKTTSAKRLTTHLRINGLAPIILCTDDYFMGEEHYPLGDDGKPDYEHIDAVDRAALGKDILALLDGKAVPRRIFDFKTKRPAYREETLALGERGIIVIEGLHGLNPALTEAIPDAQKYRIYLSALTQLGIDDTNRISTTDNRLMRRMVRDNLFRNHNALRTLRMWESVRRGEERWIFPFQHLADATFNSSLDYELSVLRPYVEPLLMEIKPDVPEYADVRRLMGFLRNFYAIPASHVPNDSLLREFIGGSLLQY